MNAPLYHKKLQRALDRQGGLYTLNDILERCADGRMQSWVHNNSWAVTQISVYPRRRLLDIVAVVGDLGDCRILNAKLVKFANEMNVDLIASYGRRRKLGSLGRVAWLEDQERELPLPQGNVEMGGQTGTQRSNQLKRSKPRNCRRGSMMPHSKITLSLKTLLRVLFSNTKDKWSLTYLTRCSKVGIPRRPQATLVFHS